MELLEDMMEPMAPGGHHATMWENTAIIKLTHRKQRQRMA